MKTRPRKKLAAIAALLSAAIAAALPAAEAPEKKSEKNLGDMSIEELMDETVTSVSKREQRLGDTAAAIAVLTNDDLRRSGATSIAEALRLVPGMDVGAVNSREWAVSARGFNGVYSNKLLVLVDGRAVYVPLFAGVYWDLQQPMFEDLERIEVIRGPGATIWGANAVNGVINVVSRSAKDTQGGLIYGGGGDLRRATGGVRFGGQIDAQTFYRVFAGYAAHDDTPLADGQPGGDNWHTWHGGFRVDRFADAATHLTWQAEVTDVTSAVSDGYNVNTLARWSREFSPRSSLELQAYYDHTVRDERERSRPTADTLDFSGQHTFGLGAQHDVIWGGGYRFIANKIAETTPLAVVRHGNFDRQLANAFMQDAFKLVPDRLTLTTGLKLEHNDITGFEFQPSVRATFKPAEQQTVWAAISRAVRTPDDVEAHDTFAITVGPPAPGPGGGLFLPTLVGDPATKAEVLWAYELGYRVQPTKRTSVDLAAFWHDYRDLISYGPNAQFVPAVPLGRLEMPWGNFLSGNTHGLEASVAVALADTWRVTADYAFAEAQIRGSPLAVREIVAAPPRHQAGLRSACDFAKRASFDAQVRYVGAIVGAPAYVTGDVRLVWQAPGGVEISVVGQNLFDRQHPEQAPIPLTVTTEAPRSFYGKLTWHF